MKTEYKQLPASFWVHASKVEDGYNTICIHQYDENDNPLGVATVDYKSDEMPANEDFSTIENELDKIGLETDIREQDGDWFHGFIIK